MVVGKVLFRGLVQSRLSTSSRRTSEAAKANHLAADMIQQRKRIVRHLEWRSRPVLAQLDIRAPWSGEQPDDAAFPKTREVGLVGRHRGWVF
jgi:hypothetical protein